MKCAGAGIKTARGLVNSDRAMRNGYVRRVKCAGTEMKALGGEVNSDRAM